MAHLIDRAVTVIGRALHQHGNTTWTVAFVAHLLVADPFQFASATLYRPVNVVLRHILGGGFVHRSS